MSWRNEFAGREEVFDVPPSITGLKVPQARLHGLEDMSWHNDACPSFGLRMTESLDLRIWCEAVRPDDRESGSDHRFTINASAWDDHAWEILEAAGLGHITMESPEPADAPITDFGTDDAEVAVRIFLVALAHMQAALRRNPGEPIPT